MGSATNWDRPLVVAHRGASATHPEHTLRAYAAALEDGADGLECDVRLTADGHLVCVHDRDLRRTGATRGVVSAMELTDLEQVDLASWKRPEQPAPRGDRGESADRTPGADPPTDPVPGSGADPDLGRVLTLRRLVEMSLDFDRPVRLAIETKHPTRYAGLVERRLAELLDDYGLTAPGSPVQVMSFSWVALRRMRRLAPDVDLVALVEDRWRQWDRTRLFLEADWLVGPGMAEVRARPDVVQRLVRRGRRVHCWVVNDPADVDLCLDLGIEALITDEPARVRRQVDAR